MDAMRSAAPLGRMLIALGEARYDGELWLQRPSGRARVSLLQGQVVSVAGVEGEPLGDLLFARGELDLARPRLRADSRFGRIGARLVASGAASRPAVEAALRGQLVRRLAQLLRGPYTNLRLAPRLHEHEHDPSAWRVSPVAAAWGALWALANEQPEQLLRETSGSERLVLTELGARRRHALDRAHERELGHVLRALDLSLPDGSLSQALCASPQPSLHPLRASLRALGIVANERAPEARSSEGYALLLRKRRELLRNANARTLLDLPGSAGPEQARRALRQLARTLHPDRYERCDARLRALFGETMSALSRAEHALRTAT